MQIITSTMSTTSDVRSSPHFVKNICHSKAQDLLWAFQRNLLLRFGKGSLRLAHTYSHTLIANFKISTSVHLMSGLNWEVYLSFLLIFLHLSAVNRRMDDWVNLEDLDLSTVELPETELDGSGKWDTDFSLIFVPFSKWKLSLFLPSKHLLSWELPV